MVTSQLNVEALENLLASGKLAPLTSQLDALLASTAPAPSETAAHVRRLRAEIARRGEGPLVDLVTYAHERLDAAADDAAQLASVAAERLRQRGAVRAAEKLVARIPDGRRPQGSTDDELARSERLATETAALLDTHDFAGAATRLDDASALHGDPDRAFELRMAAALARWSCGDTVRARELLGRLTEDTRDALSLTARRAHGIARDMLAALEREGSASPREPSWTFAERTPPAPTAAQPVPSLADLRAVLGGPSLRVILSEAQIGTILEAGCSLYLEEERSTSTGIVRVAGFEATGRVLLLEDRATRAPSLVSADEQWRRCELHGRSALITGGELARLELGDDPRLAAIDACLRGDDGAVPPQAFIVTTMESAVRADDALPLAYKLLGTAYLRRVTSRTATSPTCTAGTRAPANAFWAPSGRCRSTHRLLSSRVASKRRPSHGRRRLRAIRATTPTSSARHAWSRAWAGSGTPSD